MGIMMVSATHLRQPRHLGKRPRRQPRPSRVGLFTIAHLHSGAAMPWSNLGPVGALTRGENSATRDFRSQAMASRMRLEEGCSLIRRAIYVSIPRLAGVVVRLHSHPILHFELRVLCLMLLYFSALSPANWPLWYIRGLVSRCWAMGHGCARQ